MEDVTDADYKHAKKVWKNVELNNLSDYHGLYVQGNTILLADVFENFRNKCIDTNELDWAQFFVNTRISMVSMFQKD